MKKVTISQPLYDALAKIAPHAHTDVDTLVNVKLTELLKRERLEWIAAHQDDISTQDVTANHCTEAHLRNICGDQWELCWWASGCWLLP